MSDISPGSAHRRLRRVEIIAMAAVAILAASLTVKRLGQADVCGSNEAVEGVFVQQMVEHGHLLFPLENGSSPMYKPPLFHWTAVAIDRLAGIDKVTAFNLRLPSALYATAGVILTMLFACGRLGPDGALIAGLVLAGSYQYISEGRIGRVDMTLTFFETLVLFAFLWWLPARRGDGQATEPPRHRTATRYLFAFALGLGVLSKGPVGAILPFGAIVVFLWFEGRLAELFDLFTPGPVIVAAALSSSWYLACLFAQRYGFLTRQIGSENFGRFFGTLGWMPPWYYVKPILLNSAPLSLLVPVVVFWIARGYWRKGAGAEVSPDEFENPRARDAMRLFAIFWVLTIVFFTVAAYKRRAYLLPLWPAAAVMVAWWLQMVARKYRANPIARYSREGVAVICAALVVFNLFFLPWKEVHDCGHDSFRKAAAEINRVVGRNEPLHLYGLDEEPAPLLFYLDRNAPIFRGKLGNAPRGYIIIPASVWEKDKEEALDLNPVVEIAPPPRALLLLRHGKAYASGDGGLSPTSFRMPRYILRPIARPLTSARASIPSSRTR
jgi:4-amino-4-deoxy-L-arabinose transferase-like glycosyltransferase